LADLRSDQSFTKRPSPLRDRQLQQARRPAEAHRWISNDRPSARPNLDRTPRLVGKIEIDPAVPLGDADMDRALGTIELRLPRAD
jgi:hypothetical protein